MRFPQLERILASLAVALGLVTLAWCPPARAAEPSDAFDGVWLYMRDVDDGVSTALEIRGGSLRYLTKEGNLVAFARGWWTVNPYANPDAAGVYHVKTEVSEPIITDGPEYEKEEMEIEVRLSGTDRAEIYLAGDAVRRGVMQRIDCVPDVVFVDRASPPPPGCKWSEIRGVGFDGLIGECRWDEAWAEDWDKIRLGPDGAPTPAACLLAEPVAFPD